ncbi:Isochorismatase family protein [uncultured virus]|nr:Isochorismatase family protein [uncultured virus]
MSALLVIDCQKEFFESEGILGSRHYDAKLLSNIVLLIRQQRSKQTKIIFVRAEYNNIQNPKYPTHSGKKSCCVPSSSLSEFRDEIAVEIQTDDTVITKNYYSSFADTKLNSILKDANIDTVYLAGVTLNNCVRHTALHARELGFIPILVENCIGMNARSYQIMSDLNMNVIKCN